MPSPYPAALPARLRPDDPNRNLISRMRLSIADAALIAWLMLLSTFPAAAAVLKIQITPQFDEQNLQSSSLRYQNLAGERFSITRVSYLACDFALQKTDGSWLELSNPVAWMDLEKNRNSIRLENLPPGQYASIRFSIGLNPSLNQRDPGEFPANHPLNPNLNGLHWSWQGGYIFLALEGLWRNAAGQLDGWAYHLARDTNSALVTLAAPLVLTNDARLDLAFDLARLLTAAHPLSFARNGSSTHSRDGDPVAAALKKNLPLAFRVERFVSTTAAGPAPKAAQPLYLPANFTPYPFKMGETFPVPDLPPDNPLTKERVQLGLRLFFDPRLSVNDRQSCADCHAPTRAFTDGRPTGRGAEGRRGPRNSMPLFNLAWKSRFFWDGRAETLRAQVLEPIQNPLEMHQSLPHLTGKLARMPAGYPSLFAAAFGTSEITPEKIGLALENYLLTLSSFDAKFDRVLRGKDFFSPEEELGFQLFATEYDPRRGQFGADCFHCHGGPLFQSQGFANNGLDKKFKDAGRAKVTGRNSDLGRFAVPSLRNIALTAPYMHDGRFQTLEQVINHYSNGVKRSATLDPNLAKHPDGGVPLTQAGKRALLSFLRTLTDTQFFSPPAGRGSGALPQDIPAIR